MNNLLNEYISEIFMILEGRLENVKLKFQDKIPEEEIDSLSQNDPSKTKKYLEWMVIQRINGHKLEDIVPTVKLFDKSSQRLPIKDIYQYQDLKTLEDELKNLSPSKSQQKQNFKTENSERIYEDDEVLVLRMDSKDACISYGKGTKWCITMSDAEYYEDYSEQGAIFYFLLSKIYDDERSKIAIAVYNGKFEIYDALDNLISENTVSKSYINYGNFSNLIRNDAKNIQSKERKIQFKDKVIWLKNGKLHREDGPAIEKADGTKEWRIHGKLHREGGPAIKIPGEYEAWQIHGELHRGDGPAFEKVNGDKSWYLYGKLHRKKGPAVEKADGSKHWYLNGIRHREDGPASIDSDGNKFWHINGRQHRNDGPASVYSDGTKVWWLNNDKHREDGPAIEWANGTKEFYLYNKKYDNKKEWLDSVTGIKIRRENKPPNPYKRT